jgi:hypothetical protein
VLDPGLRRLVEEGERQIGHMLQHGDETALDRAPERLLLGVLKGSQLRVIRSTGRSPF